MTTEARPVVFDMAVHTPADDYTNFTGELWADVMRTLSTGRVTGMQISLSDNNTATISTGWGIWAGHKLTVVAAEVLPLPAIAAGGTPKTYSVGALYDPANLRTKAGPVSLKVFDKTAIDTSGGKRFWTAWEVPRSAGVALSASPLTTFDVISAGISFKYNSAGPMPPAKEYPYGFIMVTDAGLYRRGGGVGSEVWYALTDSTGWSNVSPSTGAVEAGYGVMQTRLSSYGTKRGFRGSVKRSDDGVWRAGTAVRLGSVGTASAPAYERVWSNSPLCHFELRKDGSVWIVPREDVSSTRIDGEVPL